MASSIACPASIIQAYSTGSFCDLKISCGPLTFNVHRVVVCSSCEFFKKSLNFAVGKEAEERSINLPEDNPAMINRLITYLYTGDYEPCKWASLPKFRQLKLAEPVTIHMIPHQYESFSNHECACLVRKSLFSPDLSQEQLQNQVLNPLSIHADMYALGDKYQVEGLCALATSKFSASLGHHWNSTDFITAVQTVYSSTPDSNRGMRDVVVRAFRDHFSTDITKNPFIQTKLHTIDELSFELLKSWPQKVQPSETTAKTSPFGASLASAPRAGTTTTSPFGFSGSNLQAGIGISNVAGNSRPTGSLFGGPR